MTPIGHICAHSRKPPPSIKGFLDHGAPPPKLFSKFNSPRGESSVSDGGDIPAIARRGPHGPAIARGMSRRVERPRIFNAGPVPDNSDEQGH